MNVRKNRICGLAAAFGLSAALLCGCGAAQQPAETEAEAASGAQEVSATAQTVLGPLTDSLVPLGSAPMLTAARVVEAPGTKTEKNTNATIDYSNASDGYVMIKWTGGGDKRVKALIKGPSGTTYQYNLPLDGGYQTFPLSDGSGSYTVGVYQNTSGKEYITVLSASVSASLKDEFAPFLRPNQYVNFTPSSAAVAKAKELCQGLSDNLDKVEKVYLYVVENTTYDSVKAKNIQSGYLPDVDDTLNTHKGICFDYAALMAAMLRSQDVPVKLVVGYTGDVYHAWLNVYSEDSGWIEGKIYFDGSEWKLMDPTFASSGNGSEAIMQYIGDGANYTAKYLY